MCNVTSDDQLPEVHGLLLKTARHRMYGVLASLFARRAMASRVQLDSATAPLATTKLVDDVFRNYAPGGDGLTFGKGLSPFSIVCPGHENYLQISQSIQQAQLLESGTSLTLADAQSLLSQDVRFPGQAFVAVEKLYGWSVVIDVFHGVTHPLAESIRKAVITLGPQLLRLAAEMQDTQSAGLELVCRVMYDMQQDYFTYLAQVCAGETAVVPTFARLIERVRSHRADNLSTMPRPWYSLVGCPSGTGRPGGAPETPSAAPAEMRTNNTTQQR
jgi:hypothetical protein